MNVPSSDIVFGCIIAKQTQIKKIRGPRQEFERSKIPLVEWRGIGPDPTDTIFFQETDELRAMPAGMAKFNRETKIAWQLFEKFAKRRPPVFWCERWRKLDYD